jgi:hypothetical protein
LTAGEEYDSVFAINNKQIIEFDPLELALLNNGTLLVESSSGVAVSAHAIIEGDTQMELVESVLFLL